MPVLPGAAPEVPTLIFHHGFIDDRLHALEDAETISQEMPQAQLLVESETQLQASLEDFEHVGWNEDKKLVGNHLPNAETAWFQVA